MSDDWIPVKRFPGYSIHPDGVVKRDGSKWALHTRLNREGVPYVGMMQNGVQCSRSLARLVANHFLDAPTRVFNTPIHKDGDRHNCRADNLMWRPRWYAVEYLRQFRAPYPNPINVPITVIGENIVFENSFDAACHYGLLEKEVVFSILNKTPTWPTYQQFELQ